MAKRKIDFYGTSELLNKLEKAGANLTNEIVNSLEEGNKAPKEKMINKIHEHYRTGETEQSFREEIKVNGNKITNRLGFDIRAGGLPAVFLEYGTPQTDAEGFISKAINIDEIRNAQIKALKNAFKELL